MMDSPVCRVHPDGTHTVEQWPNPWQPFRMSELALPALPGLTRHGWLWTYSADDGTPPQHWVTLRQDHRICGWHLVRADGIYFWSFLRWWLVEQAQNLNFWALRSIAIFCRRRNIGDFKSAEGFCLSWRIVFAAFTRTLPAEWVKHETEQASKNGFTRGYRQGQKDLETHILDHFDGKART